MAELIIVTGDSTGDVTLCFTSIDVKTQFLNSDSKRINVTYSVQVHGTFEGSFQPETEV